MKRVPQVRSTCDDPYCPNRYHAHGPREPEQMPGGLWKFCRHWCPCDEDSPINQDLGLPQDTHHRECGCRWFGPTPHPHTCGPGAVTEAEFEAWWRKQPRPTTLPPPKTPPREYS